MAITFLNLGASANPDINGTVSASSYSNTSWTPPIAGLICLVVLNRRSSGFSNTIPTVSGNSLTWVRIETHNADPGSWNARVTLFAAKARGSTAGVTTIDFSGETQNSCSASFFYATGADLSEGVLGAFAQTKVGDGTGTSSSLTFPRSAKSSANRPISAFYHNANEASTPRTNWTEADDLSNGTAVIDLETQWRSDTFEGVASASWTSSVAWVGLAAEIKSAFSSAFPPKKGEPFIWYFFIRDADGDPVAGATALDVEYSIDGGTFANVTGTEVDEGQGYYSCPISDTEMSGDVIGLICKTSTVGAKTAGQVIYTSEFQIGDVANPTAVRSMVSGVADSGTTTTLVDAMRKEADTDYWKDDLIVFNDGVLFGQARLVTAFAPATDTITYTPATTQTTGSGQGYEIIPHGRSDVGLWLGTAPNVLVSGRVDSSLGDIITAAANKIADFVLRRTYANARASTDGDAVSFRSLLGGIGKLVNRWNISGATLTVYQEDDTTSTAPGGTQTITTDAAADPITGLDTS